MQNNLHGTVTSIILAILNQENFVRNLDDDPILFIHMSPKDQERLIEFCKISAELSKADAIHRFNNIIDNLQKKGFDTNVLEHIRNISKGIE
jgi:hypothetical protein